MDKLKLPFPVSHVASRYAHHSGASGYDRLSDFIGEPIRVGHLLHLAGETLLRPLAIADARFGGQLEYSRHDWVREVSAMGAMSRSRKTVFHFLYGEKSYRHAWRCANQRGNKLIATLHHTEARYRTLFRSTDHLAHLDHAIVMTQSLVPIAERLVGRGKVTVVPYGIDADWFRPLSVERRYAEPSLTFAGVNLRDFRTLAQVVRLVMRRHKSARFNLISANAQCVALAEEFPERVRQFGHRPDAEYRELLQATDLMVLPLTESAAVTTVLEALACGVPVVATKGGVCDYICEDSGVLCEPGDAEAMAQAIIDVIADDRTLQRMKAAARNRGLQFAWPTIAERTAQVYIDAMSDVEARRRNV